ncbi:hypothetical protein Q4503_16520 [Colwellia sp. 6_MG-2023]|uniref:hypothetical protein n=1 Tax=Colwellia sp. 6_MG-2023 TaxID=3062676 RepID=UPI0026E49116|nr:hypothetical protein [Colwellia sp. 6_MG-2023]MDO6489301.1 hypothetical protein [Colwellia sp. 6_MG-2023]
MANEMSEKDLRDELLKNDFTAPTSWNKSRLKKELDKILSDKESTESGEKATDESSESEEETTDESSESEEETTDESSESEEETTDESSESEEETTDESSESEEETTDESSESEEETTDVKVRAKIAFSNERLKINAKEGDTSFVTPEVANYLVKIDRTCEYVND